MQGNLTKDKKILGLKVCDVLNRMLLLLLLSYILA